MRFLFLFFICPSVLFSLTFHDYPILSPLRLEYTKAYAKRHYGLDSYHLIDPKMIVIHYTAIGTLSNSLLAFKAAEASLARSKLRYFGELNVGCHYVVALDGAVYSLLPTTVMGRHIVGYNHVSIGIENVASEATHLRDVQLDVNIELIRYLLKKHPTIEYLIGHYEYMMKRYPHFALRRQLDEGYEAPIKIDPGFVFMRKLRDRLRQEHQIVLKK
ncbi:MAG: peptidoglycan recognition family protein [bacterium]